MPTSVSVLMFVSVIDPAMNTQLSPLLARKYSLVSSVDRGGLRQCSHVMNGDERVETEEDAELNERGGRHGESSNETGFKELTGSRGGAEDAEQTPNPLRVLRASA